MTRQLAHLAPKPPMGWNSFDCYGIVATESVLMANAEVMAERLKPHGYEYFVVDSGWWIEYTIPEGRQWPIQLDGYDVALDEFGRYLPARANFPNGIAPLVDRVHELGLKFGIHIMRGIARKAVELNLPIEGTDYTARDIANTDDVCKWCSYTYGVDMDRPGAQEYYDGWVRQLAAMGVDFIKADDLVGFPREVEAVIEAVEKVDRDIVLSLSPGGKVIDECMDLYNRANMLRITKDIWDSRDDLDKAFDSWQRFQGAARDGFWLDMDMIPFGHLKVCAPRDSVIDESDNRMALGGRGFERMCQLTAEQQETFITQRALAASPLFMGGDLPTSDERAFELITNPDMLACNQNGVMGHRVWVENGIEMWATPRRGGEKIGWFGVFNRSDRHTFCNLPISDLGLDPKQPARFANVWRDEVVEAEEGFIELEIAPGGVAFLVCE